MEDIFLNIVIVSFPILVYLVFSCLNLLTNKKYSKNLFYITIITSFSLCVNYNLRSNSYLFIFSSIPILISYLKKEPYLGIVLSIYLAIILYNNFNMWYISLIKLILYMIIYFVLRNKSYSNYLYLKIAAIIQGILLSFEYFSMINNFNKFILLLCVVIVLYIITFTLLYLFKLSQDITSMYEVINKSKREIELKNSLFKLTHEIKNPLAVCKGYLDMFNIKDTDSSLKYINIIRSEIERSLNIMNEFSLYNKINIIKEEFDITMLLESIYESFNVLGNSKNYKLIYDNDIDSIYINGDYQKIEQVLVNVIKNSIESILEDGIINISLKVDNKYLIVKIKDNGCGMSKSELEKIYEMFYTTKKEGTGLGVALSNEIISLHGGKMMYESMKGIGTTCTIMLPL